MAGGMSKGSSEHGTLAERIARTREAEAARAAVPAPTHGTAGFHGKRPTAWSDALRGTPNPDAPATRSPEHKHCWYDGPHGRQAALLLEWRDTGGLFHGRILVAELLDDGWALIEKVVEQGMLTPL